MVNFIRVALLAILAVPVSADVVTFGCADNPISGCDGNQYAVWMVSHVGNTYVLEYDIKVTSSYTGTHTPSDLIGAVAMKSFVSSYSNGSLILAPGGTGNWEDDPQEELSAGGCDGTAHGGTPRLCTDATVATSLFSSGNPVGILAWRWQFDSTDTLNSNSTAHIKYYYETSTGADAHQDLGSWDIAIQCTNGTCSNLAGVPEPSSIALLGAVLVSAALAARRQRAASRSYSVAHEPGRLT